MSVPPDKLMEMIGKQQGNPAENANPELNTAMSDATTSPMSAPMSTPEPKMGNREGALVNISMAMDLIEQALPSLGSESPEGQKALNAIRALSGLIGPRKQKTGELQQSEIIQMLQNLPQAGGATPEGKAMSQAPMIPGMSPSGMPPPPPPMPGGGAGGPPPSAPTGGMPQPPM
jgi:hypothetical protein